MNNGQHCIKLAEDVDLQFLDDEVSSLFTLESTYTRLFAPKLRHAPTHDKLQALLCYALIYVFISCPIA